MGIHNFSNSFNTTKLQISCKYLSKQGDSYKCIKRCLLQFAINTKETYVNLIKMPH